MSREPQCYIYLLKICFKRGENMFPCRKIRGLDHYIKKITDLLLKDERTQIKIIFCLQFCRHSWVQVLAIFKWIDAKNWKKCKQVFSFSNTCIKQIFFLFQLKSKFKFKSDTFHSNSLLSVGRSRRYDILSWWKIITKVVFIFLFSWNTKKNIINFTSSNI